jgi:hypothetical protein
MCRFRGRLRGVIEQNQIHPTASNSRKRRWQAFHALQSEQAIRVLSKSLPGSTRCSPRLFELADKNLAALVEGLAL